MTAGFLTAVESLLVTPTRVHRLGSVPDQPTYPYVAWSLALGRGSVATLDSTVGRRFGRIVAQAHGKTLESALALAEAVVGDLADRALTVTGWECSPCVIELDPIATRDSDDNTIISVTSTLTFTAGKVTR